MRGASRVSLEEVTRRLEAVLSSSDPAALGRELFEVVSLLEREHSLRRWLADPANASESKSGLIGRLLENKVSPTTVIVVSDIVQARWSKARDMVEATERAAVFATAAGAEGTQRLGELEDELFRFGRIVEAQPELRSALTREGVADEHKRTLVADLLSGKAAPATITLVTQAVIRPRGRTLEQAIDHFGQLVAERAKRYVAVVRTAVPLSQAQQDRLQDVLTRLYGRAIHLNIDIDPQIVGGLSIRVGDEVIDGTVAGRLAEVRRRLAG
ncbi:F0F1 ATP synthase subunit delta [Marinactinospora thermotolerans]|uniref:ATP synthase subunit delta n=1 Tax=Marinactinospora thermotolerans DSM 45154 TaxID=1122192 RepID=A0A1T4Q8N7_9ACTN|nr:F0F1 ATP synthase subunit delta [Marinactinospora thermotolerans]SKA00170.1 ATP synthase F1 subcomplex delta subunit [Marinactinospora thermotolerans DSM 45154]